MSRRHSTDDNYLWVNSPCNLGAYLRVAWEALLVEPDLTSQAATRP